MRRFAIRAESRVSERIYTGLRCGPERRVSAADAPSATLTWIAILAGVLRGPPPRPPSRPTTSRTTGRSRQGFRETATRDFRGPHAPAYGRVHRSPTFVATKETTALCREAKNPFRQRHGSGGISHALL